MHQDAIPIASNFSSITLAMGWDENGNVSDSSNNSGSNNQSFDKHEKK
jgi:hypothetical protein